jgi:hypothetical protein
VAHVARDEKVGLLMTVGAVVVILLIGGVPSRDSTTG